MNTAVEATFSSGKKNELKPEETLEKDQLAIRALLSTALERIKRDLQQNSSLQEPFTLERPSGEVGGAVSASYELPGGKTVMSITLVAVRTDEQMVAADAARRQQRDLGIEMDELLGTRNRHPELPDLSQILGIISFHPKRNWKQRFFLSGNSARDNTIISAESWSLFRTVHEEQVLYLLTTDSTIVGPQHPRETNTWPVPTKKIEMAITGLQEALLLKYEYTPRDERPRDLLTRGTFS